jgi:hypothetical protein
VLVVGRSALGSFGLVRRGAVEARRRFRVGCLREQRGRTLIERLFRAAGDPSMELFELCARWPASDERRREGPRLIEQPGPRQTVRERRGDFGLLGLFSMRGAQEGQALSRLVERDVVEVTDVVRVPRVAGVGRERPAIRGDRGLVVVLQREREREQRVRGVIVRGELGDAPRVQCRAPRRLFEQQLGELAIGEAPVVAALCGHRDEPFELREKKPLRTTGANGLLELLAQTRLGSVRFIGHGAFGQQR